MQSFEAFLADLGLSSPSVELDGKIHRYGSKKSQWYVGFQNFAAASGEKYINMIVGDWRTGEKKEFKSHTATKMDSSDLKRIKEQIKKAAELAEQTRIETQEQVSKEAAPEWEAASKLGGNSYQQKKQLSQLYGCKTQLYEQGRAILVPCFDIDGKLWGIQKIYGDGSKYFMPGQRTLGTFFQIGEETAKVYFCEGYATGASIHEATGGTVVCCFNAGNLVHVVKLWRKKYPKSEFIICGDDDKWTEGNPGRTKATEAAESCGARLVFPKFDNEDQKPTDFNDLHCLLGIQAVREAFQEKTQNKTGYEPLGLDDAGFHFFEHTNRMVMSFKTITDASLLILRPTLYWETMFPGVKGGINWTDAKSFVIEQSKAVGIYDKHLVRGTGVWRDSGETVINLGDRIEGDTSKSKYIYIQTRNALKGIHPNPLSTDEAYTLVRACESLKWIDPKSAFLLSGWIAIARIAGALPVRPHVWITGGAGTGKSTVMDNLIRPALGGEHGRFYLQGGSTEAGIRQMIKADSIPIIFDEFETTNEASKQRVESIVELLRQSWSYTQGHIVKGSATGEAQQYALGFAALVSSIRVVLTNDADRSRFSVLELDKHENNPEQWSNAKNCMEKITEEFGERLFTRSVKNIENILKSYNVFKGELAKIVSQRFGQQYGMLLAGWYSLISDSPVTVEIAKSAISDFGFADEKQEASVTDEQECLDQILTTRISLSIQDVPGANPLRIEKSIGEILEDNVKGELESLKDYGILRESKCIYVANQHATLLKFVFEKTRWSNCWAKTLARLPGAEKCVPKWIAGKTTRCVKINL